MFRGSSVRTLPHQNITFRNVPHRTAPQPPSGGDSQEPGIVQPGSPHKTRTTNGSRLNTATAIAARPTTLVRFRKRQVGTARTSPQRRRESLCVTIVYPTKGPSQSGMLHSKHWNSSRRALLDCREVALAWRTTKHQNRSLCLSLGTNRHLRPRKHR